MATRSVPKMYRGPSGQLRPAVRQHTAEPYDWRGAADSLSARADALSARVCQEVEQRLGQVQLPVTHAATLGDILVPERNSFGVMRFMLASAVLISHCFFLYYGSTSSEPLFGLTGYTLGQHAVQVFFFLSGVLVAQSLAQSANIKDYAIARALRVFPALIVCVLLTALGLGLWLTSLTPQNYLKDPAVAGYIVKTMSLWTGSATLPGVFESNTVAGVVNTSLWTLKYEVLCYAILAGIGALAFYSRRIVPVVVSAATIWFAYMIVRRPELKPTSGLPEVLAYFTLFFGAGVSTYLLRDQIRLNGVIALALGAVAWLALKTNFAEIAFALFLGYGVLWLSTYSFGSWRDFANTSDYSYGVYIYSMPITQALLLLRPDLNIVALISAAMGLTLLAAFLSWELIERPALNLRYRFRSERVADYADVSNEVRTQQWQTARPMMQESPAMSPAQAAGAPLAPEPAVSTNRLRFAARVNGSSPLKLSDAELAHLRARMQQRSALTH